MLEQSRCRSIIIPDIPPSTVNVIRCMYMSTESFYPDVISQSKIHLKTPLRDAPLNASLMRAGPIQRHKPPVISPITSTGYDYC
jgi:hypothetical protein